MFSKGQWNLLVASLFSSGQVKFGTTHPDGKMRQSLKLYTGSVIIAILLVVEKILTRN